MLRIEPYEEGWLVIRFTSVDIREGLGAFAIVGYFESLDEAEQFIDRGGV